jgi:hypothetical protein
MQQRLDPWLLLVTGVVSREISNTDTAKILFELFLGALECDGFEEACTAYFENQNLRDLDIDSCGDSDYFHAIAIGFCIWVFKLAHARLPTRINLRAAFHYQVFTPANSGHLVSMALRFTPQVVAPSDPSGLAREEGAASVRLCDAALQLGRKFQNAVDVDLKLENDTELRDQLVNETARLLVEVGYDEGDYRDWVAQWSS